MLLLIGENYGLTIATEVVYLHHCLALLNCGGLYDLHCICICVCIDHLLCKKTAVQNDLLFNRGVMALRLCDFIISCTICVRNTIEIILFSSCNTLACPMSLEFVHVSDCTIVVIHFRFILL